MPGESNIVVDDRRRPRRDPSGIGQVEVSENDLVTPHLAQKIREHGTTAFSTYSGSKRLGIEARNLASATGRSADERSTGGGVAAVAEPENAPTAGTAPRSSIRRSSENCTSTPAGSRHQVSKRRNANAAMLAIASARWKEIFGRRNRVICPNDGTPRLPFFCARPVAASTGVTRNYYFGQSRAGESLQPTFPAEPASTRRSDPPRLRSGAACCRLGCFSRHPSSPRRTHRNNLHAAGRLRPRRSWDESESGGRADLFEISGRAPFEL
jgi:hypothetical protein